LLGFGVPMVLMSVVALFVYNNTRSMLEDGKWVEHTHEVIADVQELLTLVVDMETGQRGFLITGKEHFLEPFSNSLEVWNEKVRALQKLVSDNPVQVKKLELIDNLQKQWLKDAAEIAIKMRQNINSSSVGMNDLTTLIEKETGKKIIDDIRLNVAHFVEHERP